MVSTLVVALLGGLAATASTAAATGDASVLAHAAQTVPPGLQVAMAHVPSASHAYEVLKAHLSLYAGTGTAGTVGAGGASMAVKHGLTLGLGK
ncbi:MAG: hypothetical protein JRN16_03945 [Nitrososphaerota archaeon]|jgi:hypothetical protein|nr:hypothetical protein [Nitrososphaerota archaeon]MDG7027545.1 hypothetical protein [Nitrososphaerota archaeon]